MGPVMDMRSRLLCAGSLLLLSALPGPATARGAEPGYTIAETGRTFSRLQDAVNAIGNGSGTIRFGSFAFADCAVQEGGDITYVATVNGQSVLDGVSCEGKAALVLRGRSARVVGLVFANMRVPDWNGAGIRLERGNLSVSQSWFRDSQQGILTGNDRSAQIVIDKSTFTRLGTCEGPGGCAHSIYVGDYGRLTVTRSRFEEGRGGHYVKSRAARIEVLDSNFDDSGGRQTNYMIDLPAGATGRIAGNAFLQGASKENHSALIVIAAEERLHASAGLRIENNRAHYAPGARRDAAFVFDWSGEAISVGSNDLDPGFRRFDRGR